MIQREMHFIDTDAYDGMVIQENPYVKILGKVTWSSKHRSYTAVAQVENRLCAISVNLKGDNIT